VTDFNDFVKFAENSKIFDKNLTKSGVVVLFIAANYEVDD
jgi:hypothetical protein